MERVKTLRENWDWNLALGLLGAVLALYFFARGVYFTFAHDNEIQELWGFAYIVASVAWLSLANSQLEDYEPTKYVIVVKDGSDG